MGREKVRTGAIDATPTGGRVFTLEEANRALVLVRRIVKDIVDRYAEVTALRAEREELSRALGPAEKLDNLRARTEERVAELNRLSDELGELGCELKDWASGLVDFPALHQGRRVCLCWRLGESAIAQWHEIDAGFAGRKPIEADFGTTRVTESEKPG
ncbi:MAG: DUF2203 domain-containing protein [Phycisphaerae bacterium]